MNGHFSINSNLVPHIRSFTSSETILLPRHLCMGTKTFCFSVCVCSALCHITGTDRYFNYQGSSPGTIPLATGMVVVCGVLPGWLLPAWKWSFSQSKTVTMWLLDFNRRRRKDCKVLTKQGQCNTVQQEKITSWTTHITVIHIVLFPNASGRKSINATVGSQSMWKCWKQSLLKWLCPSVESRRTSQGREPEKMSSFDGISLHCLWMAITLPSQIKQS